MSKGELCWHGEHETRRHNTPRFVGEFEDKLIRTLFGDCSTTEEARSREYERCLRVVTEEIDRVMTGRDLVVSKILRKSLDEYNSLFPNVAAGLQLASRGKLVRRCDVLDFIFTNAGHPDPLCRTTPAELLGQERGAVVEYDRARYRDLLLDAAETILGTFGFSRDLYCDRDDSSESSTTG